MTVVLFLMASTANAGWVEGTVQGVRDDNSKSPIAIFVNTYAGIGVANGVWTRVKVADWGIPADAKSVFLAGLLIITHGTTAQTCNITITFRAPDNTLTAGNYIGQTIEAATGGGQRSNMATWTPVKNGEIEFLWQRGTTGQWPTECAYAINLSAQSYVR